MKMDTNLITENEILWETLAAVAEWAAAATVKPSNDSGDFLKLLVILTAGTATLDAVKTGEINLEMRPFVNNDFRSQN